MTGRRKRTIVEMAQEAGLYTHKEVQPELEAFAKLVREDEREACVKECKFDRTSADIEIAIRARGQA